MTMLPPYTVRESARARNVNLRISMEGGLEVVIPRGFNRRLIPDILHKKGDWIQRTTHRLAERREFLEADPPLPAQIALAALGETWRVDYRPGPANRVTLTEQAGQRLTLTGAVDQVDLCQAVLRRWLAHRARQRLELWLRQISVEEKLPFAKVTIRGQKSRWGSCSPARAINLNYKLLFLPPALVRYVLIHELCHTQHLNHSAKFWALVSKKEPAYKRARIELRAAWRFIPGWTQD